MASVLLTVTDIYSVRFEPKPISLPAGVLAKIERLRVTPVPYKPVRAFNRNANRFRSGNPPPPDNWRENVLKDFVRRVKEREDPEYSDVFSIFNRISPSNVDKLSADVVTLIQKRDQQFRLRVSMLLFDKAITQSFYSALMAECAARIQDVIPEISDDLQSQISLFPTLYDMTETMTFPADGDKNFDDKVIQWTKQKDKRRGYAKFMMELFALGLITEESVKAAFEQVVNELNATACQRKTTQTEENTTQFVTFLFECSKTAKGELRAYLRGALDVFTKLPRDTLPSLNMRSRFKVEDALKELNKEEKS